MNVHKRCQKNVANNCGINVKQLSEILADMGIRPQEAVKPSKKKVSTYFVFLKKCYMFLISIHLQDHEETKAE